MYIARKIWVTFQRAGLHKYPAASDDAKLADVNYLGSVHRHLFKFKVGISVEHNDRDIEFHQFLNWLESLFDDRTINIDYMSCEMLAEQLLLQINVKFPSRSIEVEVAEDGECGAVLSYNYERV